MKSFAHYLQENWMYHGTSVDVTALRPNTQTNIIDQAIGVHFAADVGISKKFAKGGIYGRPQTSNGFIYRVEAPPDSKCLRVYQKRYRYHGQTTARQSDQDAIGAFVASTVFEERPDLAVKWMSRARNISQDLATRVYQAIKNGETLPADWPDRRNIQSLRYFMANFDSQLFMMEDGDKQTVIKAFDDIMARNGIDALIYLNTAPMEVSYTGLRPFDREVSVRSPKCYVLLNHALSRYPIEKIPLQAL